jgi:hypothetical protein
LKYDWQLFLPAKGFLPLGKPQRRFSQAQNLTRELRVAIDTNPWWIRPTYATVRPGFPLIFVQKGYLPRAQFCNI